MRLFEIMIFVFIFAGLVGRQIPCCKKTVFIKLMPFAAIAAMMLNIIIEGYRWQMVPIYIFSVCCLIIGIVELLLKKDIRVKSKFIRVLYVVFAFIAYFASLIWPLLLPVVDLPAPHGEYGVGTISFRMIDYEREEIYTEEKGDARNFLVTAWYPTDVKDGEVEKYWDEQGITGKAYSINSGMGTFWYSHLSLSKTNSIGNAPVSSLEDTYPVIIYSPSFYGLNSENTMLFEELASNGYIVFSISHSYETIVSIYPDGEVIYGDLSYFSEVYDDNYLKEEQLYKEYEAASSREEKERIIGEILTVDDSSTKTIEIRTEDVLFLLDEIERMNSENNIFSTKLNLDNIGIIGWSFGGATAEEACMMDDRIKAGVNIDGWPYGQQFASGAEIEQPFMIIQSDSDEEMEEIIGESIYGKIAGPAYYMKISDTTHLNFWDFPMFFDIYKYIGYWGTMDAKRLNTIHREYTIGFFNKYLKGEDIDLFENAFKEFAEITYKTKN
ncbi:MAG: dienelactone hydrolase family protein [Clostridia bacterium]|nr:dienelactone hydrolase family protein [Clostridia bacterium]